jgi:serine/threonine-protein kinase
MSAWENPVFKSRRAVDLLCRQFEELWHTKNRLSIEGFLATTDSSYHDALLPELIAAEWDLRAAEDQSPQRSDYIMRFPHQVQLLAELEVVSRGSAESHASGIGPREPSIGEDFSGYRILKELGRGAMGTVYLAEVPVVGHKVALKILSSRLQQDPIGAARFEREAKLLSRLDHPGIVPLYSYGEFNGVRYLIMKAIDGTSLSSAISGEIPQNALIELLRGPQSSERFELLMSLAIQLSKALKAVHDADVLHRDIKPSNVLLTESGRAYLTDFSLARIESAEVDLTRSDEFVGTLRYCAPESLDGKYSKQSDVYSLGLVLFEMFSLRTPFESAGRRELLSQKLSGNISVMRTSCDGISEPLYRVLRRMTQYDPDERYQSAADVIDALSSCLQQKPQPAFETSRKWLISVGSLITVLMLMMALLNSGTRPSRQTRASTTRMPSSAADSAVDAGRQRKHDAGNNDSRATLVERSSLSKSTSQISMTSFATSRVITAEDQNVKDWLIPQRVFELPGKTEVTLMSMSADGEHLMIVLEDRHLISGPLDSDQLPVTRQASSSRIVAVDQSFEGGLMMLCHTEQQGTPGQTIAQCFVETYAADRGWERVPGPSYAFKTTLPAFTGSSKPSKFSALLIPDTIWPTLWLPAQGSLFVVSWPAGHRAAIACFALRGAMAMSNGEVQLFLTGSAMNAKEPLRMPTPVQTPITECRCLKFSSDGSCVLIMGNDTVSVIDSRDAELVATHDLSGLKSPDISFSNEGEFAVFSDAQQIRILDLRSQKWLGEPLLFQDELIHVSAIANDSSVLAVESSGRISLHSLKENQWRQQNEQRTEPLSNATFRESQRRLVIATHTGQIATFEVPAAP